MYLLPSNYCNILNTRQLWLEYQILISTCDIFKSTNRIIMYSKLYDIRPKIITGNKILYKLK